MTNNGKRGLIGPRNPNVVRVGAGLMKRPTLRLKKPIKAYFYPPLSGTFSCKKIAFLSVNPRNGLLIIIHYSQHAQSWRAQKSSLDQFYSRNIE